MKAIIFGINGQDGFYLNGICGKNNIETIGVSRSDGGSWRKGSVADFSFVDALIQKERPDFIFHLAANSSTRHEALFENHETISTGAYNILESAKRSSPHSRIFIAGSGVQFRNTGRPIKETDEFEGSSPYSVSRIQSVYAARYYRSLGLKTYTGYLFHHESPLRKHHHVSKLIAEHVKSVREGSGAKLRLGDINVKKEWGFAGDIAEGIFRLVSQDKEAEATIGTGTVYSIRDWLEACFRLIGKNWQDYIELDNPGFIPEYKLLVSDPSTIFGTGWRPVVGFEDLASMMTGQA